MTINLPPSEYFALKALATYCNIPAREILEQFVADLTCSPNSGGSDERMMASHYILRCNYASPLHGVESDDPQEQALMEKQKRYAETWANKAPGLKTFDRDYSC